MKKICMLFFICSSQIAFSQNNAFTNSPLKMKILKMKCTGECDRVGAVFTGADTISYGGVLREGDVIKIIIENTSSRRQYYSLLDIQPDNIINLLVPGILDEPREKYIEAKQSIEVLQASVIPPFGAEKFLLISEETSATGDLLRRLDLGINNSRGQALKNQKYLDSINAKNPQALLQEVTWILQGQASVLFSECFYSVLDFAILPKKNGDKAATNFSRNTGLSSYANYNLKKIQELFVEGQCLDKRKKDSLYYKYPLVSFIQPLQGGPVRGILPEHETDTKTFVLKGNSTTEKGTKKVLVNGEEADITPLSDMGIISAWSKEVFLQPGKNHFTIISTTNEGYSNCEEITLSYNEKEKRVSGEGHNYSLFIGINKYKNLTPLNCGQKDAKDLRNLLLSQYEFDPQYSVELYDQNATRDNIDSVFRVLMDKLTPEDNLLVYYAGHGLLDKHSKKVGYWLPVESRIEKYGDYIHNSMIKNYMETLLAKHVLIFADACFSGSFFNGSRDVKFIEKVDAIKSRWLFCSGREEVVSDCMAGKHNSPFANYIIDFLTKYRGGGLSSSQLYQAILPAVTNNSNQTPIAGPVRETGDEGGEFIFRRRVK